MQVAGQIAAASAASRVGCTGDVRSASAIVFEERKCLKSNSKQIWIGFLKKLTLRFVDRN